MSDYKKAVEAMKRLMKDADPYIDSEYLRALIALGWLNLNTDYRANNISGDYPQSYKQHVGGMFGLSKFSSKESLDIITGNELVSVAMREGWKDE
jgi:hypothetical protein